MGKSNSLTLGRKATKLSRETEAGVHQGEAGAGPPTTSDLPETARDLCLHSQSTPTTRYLMLQSTNIQTDLQAPNTMDLHAYVSEAHPPSIPLYLFSHGGSLFLHPLKLGVAHSSSSPAKSWERWGDSGVASDSRAAIGSPPHP